MNYYWNSNFVKTIFEIHLYWKANWNSVLNEFGFYTDTAVEWINKNSPKFAIEGEPHDRLPPGVEARLRTSDGLSFNFSWASVNISRQDITQTDQRWHSGTLPFNVFLLFLENETVKVDNDLIMSIYVS